MKGSIIVALVLTVLLSGATVFSYVVSKKGIGLPPNLTQPVSIRQASKGAGGHRSSFLYFGTGRSRSHLGGGFRGGK